MHAAFIPKRVPTPCSFDANNGVRHAARVAMFDFHFFPLPCMKLRGKAIHLQQIARPNRGFKATHAAANFQNQAANRAIIRHNKRANKSLHACIARRLQPMNFAARHGGDIRVRVLGKQFAFAGLALQAPPLAQIFYQRLRRRASLRQHFHLAMIGHDVGVA